MYINSSSIILSLDFPGFSGNNVIKYKQFRLAIYARNSPLQPWRLYANTETVERTSNPVFLVTVQLRAQDGVSDRTQVYSNYRIFMNKDDNINKSEGKSPFRKWFNTKKGLNVIHL